MDEITDDDINNINSKDTRWDRIRKRHMNSLNVKTETVKKFFEIDFIGKRNLKLLNGDIEPLDNLNPALVMDLRHEMIERMSRKKREISIEKEIAMDKLKAHNNAVEEHYIENELTKYKTELEKTRLRSNKRLQRPKLFLNLSNKNIYKSLQNCTETIDDFYCAPIEALQEATRISEESTENARNFKSEENNLINISTDNLKINFQSETDNSLQDRCVRFEDSVEIHNYSREQSLVSSIKTIESDVENESDGEVTITMVGKQFDNMKISDATNGNAVEISTNIQTEETDQNYSVDKIRITSDNLKSNNNKNLVFTVNDDLLRIRRALPDSNDLQVIVQMKPDEIDDDTVTPQTDSEIESNEQNAIIADIFRTKCPPTEIVMRKYFLKWVHFTTIEKIEKHNFSNKDDRIHKINAFLEQIRREKRRLPKDTSLRTVFDLGGKRVNCDDGKNQTSVVITKKYQNKIKVQQDIIELQKLKLERQERMIMELKLNKLAEAAKLSQQEIKNELKTVIRTGDVKNRSKAKCLQLVGNLRDNDDDEFSRLQGKALLMPKFLEKMQERALERSIKHEQARQRRLQQDAEREAAKIATEEAKRLEDEEAKHQRIEALKEKRRQEKMSKIIKERERQRYLEISKKSEEFCRKRLLRRYGMEAFKRLLIKKRKNYKKSEIFRRHKLKRKMFKVWVKFYVEIWETKALIANNLYIKILLRTTFRGWKLYMANERSKFMVAVDWHELKLTEYIFNRWLGYSKLQKIIEETKTKQAESHFQWHLKWRILDRWQRLPQVLKLEKETEERRQRWRLKIWELLPDYTPNRLEQF